MYAPSLNWWPPDTWPENSPDSLLELSLGCLVNNPDVFLDYDDDLEEYSLKHGITLPHQICEQLISMWGDNNTDVVDSKFLHIFENTQRTKLKRVNLANSVVTDASLKFVMKHKPRELNIDNCHNLTSAALNIIEENSENLVALFIGEQSQLFLDLKIDDEEDMSSVTLFDCPRLQALSIHNLGLNESELYLFSEALTPTLLTLSSQLVYLDLSECVIHEHVNVLSASLGHISNLTTLLLYDLNLDIIDPYLFFNEIKKLKKLRALDLSQSKEQPVLYKHPEDTLRDLVQNLPKLTHLDLSRTNLPGFVCPPRESHRAHGVETDNVCGCSIPGLEGRHLDFLGLLNCPYEASRRDNIPAKEVAGDANEEQIILAIHKYNAKCDLLLKALNSIFQLCRYSECRNQRKALHAILIAMRKHPLQKTIQISGSASLFYICKSDDKHNFSTKVRRVIIRTILDAMENHSEETTMLRNGCLTLCHFKIPQDLLFDYESVVKLLLDIVQPSEQEEFVQHVGIYLLNSLACQVDGREKQLVGDLGAITAMLRIIEVRLYRGICDEVLEIAWSTMWNVTDETALNCERFIEGDGMELFMKCLQKFPDKDELLRNMMGLLGNVAEVPYLRPKLMHSEYVDIFSGLLDSTSDGIEVSYNACGVLAHLVSDGVHAWTIDTPSRGHVLQRMVTAISRWKLNTKRNINYRSFEPILRLLPKFETPEAQHWATWALCNLTRMYRKKYCALVEREQGVHLLEDLTNDPRPFPETKDLAYHVIRRCRMSQDTAQKDSEDDMDVDIMDDDDND